MKGKIIISTGILLVMLLSFVYAEVIDLSASVPNSATLGSPQDISISTTHTKIIQYECEGCLKDEKCYSIGTRITSESTKSKFHLKTNLSEDLLWASDERLYCEADKTNFVAQKLTGESCENDFECESNKCVNKKCEQKNGITITEKSNENGIVIKNLFFKEKEKFYFQGKNNNYSIKFGDDGGSFIFFINDNFYSYKEKIFKLDEKSNLILNSVSFENSIAYANLTLIESDSIVDVESLLKEINCKGLIVEGVYRKEGEIFYKENKEYKIENSSLVEIPKENSSPITGNTIKENEQNQERNSFQKFLYWIKKIFD